jgi:putative transposase|tara:strand:- start:149 stop:559 length:411 start_codon:yes stop_codon:yes gene_type:complete
MNKKREIKSSKYHVVLTLKYRKNFLINNIKFHVEKSLKHKAKDLNVDIKNIEVMPDHVHIFISIPITLSISKVVHQLKGFSSFETRKNLNLYNYKSFWSSGYFCESISHISEPVIRKYIDNQWDNSKYNNLNSSSH